MRWLAAMCTAVLELPGCSFAEGQLAPLADDAGTTDSMTDASGLQDPPDASASSTNVAATSAGATLVSFTSEYCTPSNTPVLCQTGYWNRTNINDGMHATGDNQTAYRAAWASQQKQNANPEEFELAFRDGRTARIERFVIQNWGRGNGNTLYYSTHAKIYGRASATSEWALLVDTPLATTETPQTFVLDGAVVVERIRLSITDGLRDDYWELGELEAWGWLQ
jgi:hypothetical protein